MFYSWERKAILLGIEVAYGVDPVLNGMAHGILAQNLTISVEADKLEREIDRSFFTGNPFVLVGKRVVVEFDFEPLGANPGGVVAPSDAILRACAHAGTADVGPPLNYAYNPISTAIESAAIYLWMGDQRFVILGARGTLNWEFKIKTFGKAHARLTGMFAIPTSVPIVNGDTTDWQDPPAIEMETWDVSVDGTTVNAESVTLDMAQETPMLEGSNEREVVVVDRKANGVLRLFDPDVANLNLWTMAASHDKVPIICEVNGGTGKLTRFTIPLAQLELPRFAEIERTRGLEIPFTAIASSSGDDEYLLEFE